MRENNTNKLKLQKNIYTHNLFQLSRDDDFFKSSSRDLSDSVSFKKEIRKSINNEKMPKKNDILKINQKQKIINLKGTTSSSATIKNYFKNDEEEEDEKSDNNNKITLYNKENIDNEKKIKNNSKTITNSNNYDTSNDEEDIKKVLSSNISYNINYNGKKNNSQNNVNNHLKINEFNYNYNNNNPINNSQNLSSFICDSSSNFNNNEEKNQSHIENPNYLNKNKNKKNFTNIKPINIRLRSKNKNEKNENNSNIYKTKKVSFIHTNVEQESSKINKENAEIAKKIIKKISQRDFSIKSSNSSNESQTIENNNIKIFMEKYLLNISFIIIMYIMNIFSLFSNDIMHIWLNKNVDIYFDIINLITVLYFILEIFIFLILDEGYFNSLIFWIDIVGTILIIFNVELITNYIFGYNDIAHSSSRTTNSTIEYLNIVITMLERVLRMAKVLKCLKFHTLIEVKNKFKHIFSEKQHRDLVKKEIQKQKLIKKIKNFETDLDIDESVISSESIHPEGSSSSLSLSEKKIENKEENNEDINSPTINRRVKKISTIAKIRQKEDNKGEKEGRVIKRAFTTKRLNRLFLKRNTLKTNRQNNINMRNSTKNINTINIFYFDEDEKKEEEINKEIEEKIYKKFEEKIKNTKITNRVRISMRKKIIIFFIIILLISIILNEKLFSNYENKDNILFYSYILDSLFNCSSNNTTINRINNFLLSSEGNDFLIINITKNDILLYENKNVTKNYRFCELVKISANNDKNNGINEVINIFYSVKKENNIKHIFYLILTIIITSFLIITSILSGKDLNNILLSPIEVMIEVADGVSKDPMKAKNIEELEQKVIALLEKDKEENKQSNKSINKKFNECYNSYEVKVIMNAIIKISALLAMSLGEAGGEIIHKNLSSKHNLHLHSRGKKKSAIFGFCNIRNFEEINLALEEKTIPLINQIAEIVHSSVDKFRGNTNKNIGDSFFSVWKFYNNINVKDNNNRKLIKDNLLEKDPLNPQINITADCAVLAYLRCILKINKNLNILKYNNNKKLNKIIPNFKISMGFGLHLGYGIEGPIGSIFKMEASYLSPNVNIAARLETATKQFGVSLLISGKLYNLLTEEMKEVCRYVDCVRVKGSSEPIDLYTIDINYNVTPQERAKIRIIQSYEEKVKISREKKTMLECLIQEYGSITPFILEKKNYLELIDEKSEFFYDAWENAMDLYKKGNWKEAKKYFEDCLNEDSNDGPANTLYNYIKKFNFESPKDWKGERILTNK